MNIQIIHTKNLRWIDVTNPGDAEMDWLKQNFRLHPLHFETLAHAQPRTLIDEGDGYNLIVLLFPVYHREIKEIMPGEVDFVVGNGFLITVHYEEIYTMKTFFNQVRNSTDQRNQNMQKGGGFLLYRVLENLFKRSYPILDHMNEDLEGMEKMIFRGSNVNLLSKIALMNRNIIEFRKMMKTHRFILEKLLVRKNEYLSFLQSKLYYKDLLEYSENIWDILEALKETSDTLTSTNQALAAHRLNKLTQIISIFSAILLPATLIAFVFGVSMEGIPFRTDPLGFWIVVALMIASSLITTVIFMKKKWF